MSHRRPFNRFRNKRPSIPIEKKVEMFILKNSQNGYFTKFSTITSKFNISEPETWNVVGMLLSDGGVESIHDPNSGEMKICETGKKYHIMSMSRKRRFEEKPTDRSSSSNNHNHNHNNHNSSNRQRRYRQNRRD